MNYRTLLDSLTGDDSVTILPLFCDYSHHIFRLSYIPSTRTVREGWHVHEDGMSLHGYYDTQVPESVQTLGELVDWYAQEKDLPLKDDIVINHNTRLSVLVAKDSVSILHLFRGYDHSMFGLEYIPSTRTAREMQHFHTETQSVYGYFDTQVPETVLTFGELADWYAQEKKLVNTEQFRLLWQKQMKLFTCRKERITVGRSRLMDLTFSEASWSPYLSRRHCVFSRMDGKWYLTDLGSTNHTWVNKIPLAPDVPVALTPGDVIKFGRQGDEFLFDPPEEKCPSRIL